MQVTALLDRPCSMPRCLTCGSPIARACIRGKARSSKVQARKQYFFIKAVTGLSNSGAFERRRVRVKLAKIAHMLFQKRTGYFLLLECIRLIGNILPVWHPVGGGRGMFKSHL